MFPVMCFAGLLVHGDDGEVSFTSELDDDDGQVVRRGPEGYVTRADMRAEPRRVEAGGRGRRGYHPYRRVLAEIELKINCCMNFA